MCYAEVTMISCVHSNEF